jgi:hypothetical protein
LAAVLAVFLAGCTQAGFPDIQQQPAGRAETPLTPDQVKQATDSLISERDKLSTEVQANPQSATATAPAQPNSVGTGTTGATASASAQAAGANNKP